MTLSQTPEHEYSDRDWMEYLRSLDIPHLNQWMQSQAERGQDYYLRRIDQLGLSGRHVLDAGCGVGNWAIALTRRFDLVEAMDSDAERIGVLNGIASNFGGRIHASVGSVIDLQYDDCSFDTVFCNGVVFLTDTDEALAEFYRVLRPGGELYVTYNGPDWWRHLIRDRGPNEPDCYIYGANGLITWAFRLAGEVDLQQLAGDEDRAKMEAARSSEDTEEMLSIAREVLAPERRPVAKSRQSADLASCIDELTQEGVPPEYAQRLALDLSAQILMGQPDHEILAHTYTHRPEDTTATLSRLGFADIMSAREGCLRLNVEAKPATPIYTSGQGVFETLAHKP